ncbi:MAG: hypothetical protein LBU32_22925 [Clostridiales bacterium]|nr:hypothetical protein [Clostridiales bacterium]
MGLVKFKKNLTESQYLALEEKNAETLYFLSDTKAIYLGSEQYGGADLSEWLTDTIDASSTDQQVPVASAVYDAFSKIAPVWDSETASGDMLSGGNSGSSSGQWLEYIKQVKTTDSWTIGYGVYGSESYFQSDGKTARFILQFVTSDFRYESEKRLANSLIIESLPKKLRPLTNVEIPYTSHTDSGNRDAVQGACGSLYFETNGRVSQSNNVLSLENGGGGAIIMFSCGWYPVAEVPDAPLEEDDE